MAEIVTIGRRAFVTGRLYAVEDGSCTVRLIDFLPERDIAPNSRAHWPGGMVSGQAYAAGESYRFEATGEWWAEHAKEEIKDA